MYKHKYKNIKTKRNKTPVNYKRLLLLIVILSFVVIGIRGIILSNVNNTKTPQSTFIPDFSTFNEKYTLNVYLSDEKRVVTMGLEEYVFGVTAAEMPALFNTEAIKAQAIAARTFAIRHVKNTEFSSALCCNSHDTADICTDSTCCQAYRSIEKLKARWGSDFSKYSEKVFEAIASTQGKIITYEGKPIEALFHAVSGGKTEDCCNVFSQELPYLVSVDSPNEESSSNFSETKTFSVSEFYEKLSVKVTSTPLSKQIKHIKRFPSGRIDTMEICGKLFSGKQLRSALELKSTNLSFEFSDDTITITTKGYGHGVGMSQAGANAMAQNGYSFSEIISHYYFGTSIDDI